MADNFSYQGFEEARAIARRRRMRIFLPIAIVVTMLCALTGNALYGFNVMRADALTLSEEVITNLQSRIETEVASFQTPIPAVIRPTRGLLRDGNSPDLVSERTESLLQELLRSSSQLSALFVGTINGEFLMVRREPDGYSTKLIRLANQQSDRLEVVATRYDQDLQQQDKTIGPWDQYDPRVRPWYQGAALTTDTFWTDVYPFFTDQTAGITAATALSTGAVLRAVVGADVTLSRISKFLASLQIGESGKALVIDERGRVIAHPTQFLIQQNSNGGTRLIQVANLTKLPGSVEKPVTIAVWSGH